MPSSTSNDVSLHNTSVEAVVGHNGTDEPEDEPRNAAKPGNGYGQPTVEQRYHDLQLAHKRLQDELKRLQHQDFNARNKDEGQSHHVVSAQFLDVFRQSTDWARDYFKIPFTSFRIAEYELFMKNLDGVLCGGCDWSRKKKMNVSHLVQAVVADVLARRILLPQFAGCPGSARHEFCQMYDVMLKENESKALKWRATTFAAYGRCELWAPFDSFTPPESPSMFRQAFYKTVAEEIDMIVGPIARSHFPNRGDDQERFQRSMVFIEAAGNLAITLGNQAAKLEIMDKSWFERSQRVFLFNDDRMKGRFAEEYEESEEGFQVDIILRPGFLKYGNDEGENLENYAVWIPAILDLSEKYSYEDAQEKPNGNMPRNNVTTPHSLPERSSSYLPRGNTPATELLSVESVMPLPRRDHQLHPLTSFPDEAVESEIKPSTSTPLEETAGRHRKLPKSDTHIGKEGNTQTVRVRRRDALLKPVKKCISWTLSKAQKQSMPRSS